MARLFSSGFELNSLTAAVEWDAAVGGTISSSTTRSGTYAGRISSLVSGTNQRFRYQFKSTASNGPFYFRFYLRIAALPSAENRIFVISSSSSVGTGTAVYLTIDNGGLMRLYDEDGQIGSASSALSTDTWYRIEVLFDKSPGAPNHIVTARIDGSNFASSTSRNVSVGVSHMYLGGNLASETQTTGDWFFDDVAINDNTGSFQTSYPGSGKIIHLRPSAAGDSNGFSTQVGGTAGSSNNFTRVNEVTPNDATSYNGSAVLNSEDLFNCDDSGINVNDIVNVVSVGVRMANLVSADATAAFKVEIEKTSGGTKAQSAALIPNSTTWRTNTTATPWLYPLITYQDPDNANWTQSTLDSMQIGYIQTATNAQAVAVSTLWALVEYDPLLTYENISVSESIKLEVESYINKSESVAVIDTVDVARDGSRDVNRSDSISVAESSTVRSELGVVVTPGIQQIIGVRIV